MRARTPHSCTSDIIDRNNANSDEFEKFDGRLRMIVERWGELPESIRLGIAALVQAVNE